MIKKVVNGSLVEARESVILLGVGATPGPQHRHPLLESIEKKFWPGLTCEGFALGEIKKQFVPKKTIIAVCCHSFKIADWQEVGTHVSNALYSLAADATVATVVIGCAQAGGNQSEREQAVVLDAFERALQEVTIYYKDYVPYAFDHPAFSHLVQ